MSNDLNDLPKRRNSTGNLPVSRPNIIRLITRSNSYNSILNQNTASDLQSRWTKSLSNALHESISDISPSEIDSSVRTNKKSVSFSTQIDNYTELETTKRYLNLQKLLDDDLVLLKENQTSLKEFDSENLKDKKTADILRRNIAHIGKDINKTHKKIEQIKEKLGDFDTSKPPSNISLIVPNKDNKPDKTKKINDALEAFTKVQSLQSLYHDAVDYYDKKGKLSKTIKNNLREIFNIPDKIKNSRKMLDYAENELKNIRDKAETLAEKAGVKIKAGNKDHKNSDTIINKLYELIKLNQIDSDTNSSSDTLNYQEEPLKCSNNPPLTQGSGHSTDTLDAGNTKSKKTKEPIEIHDDYETYLPSDDASSGSDASTVLSIEDVLAQIEALEKKLVNTLADKKPAAKKGPPKDLG